MPRAEPPSQGETEVAKQSESVAELAAGLESSGLDEITMQLNPQGQKRQQPEPADDPELSNHQPIHPLKRLRKSSPEEAPRSPPTAIPSSLEDSLSDRDQTEACLDGRTRKQMRGLWTKIWMSTVMKLEKRKRSTTRQRASGGPMTPSAPSVTMAVRGRGNHGIEWST